MNSQTYTELVRGLMEDIKETMQQHGVECDSTLYSALECRVCDALTEATIIAAQNAASTLTTAQVDSEST